MYTQQALTVLESRKSKIKVPTDSVSTEGLLLIFTVTSHSGRGNRSLLGTNHIHEGPASKG